MKVINRAELRGKPLERNCYGVHTTKHEFGKNDNRIFCYGIVDSMTDELLPQCKECRAMIDYAEPMEEDGHATD